MLALRSLKYYLRPNMISEQQVIAITRQMIHQHYPELIGKRLNICFMSSTANVSNYVAIQHNILGSRLLIANHLRYYSLDAISGCIARELAFLSLWGKNGNYWTSLWRWTFMRRTDPVMERSADELVIERGIGHYLVTFHDYCQGDKAQLSLYPGMTAKEVKKAVKYYRRIPE